MRVLAVTPLYVPWVGGLEILVRDLVAALRRRGHEFLVLTSHGPESGSGPDEVDGVPVLRVPLHRVLADRDPAALLRLQRQVAGAVAAFAPDLVHSHDVGPVLWLARRACRGAVPPVLLTLHNVVRDRTGLDARRESLAGADFVTGVSADVVDDAVGYAPEIEGKCAVVVNGIPPVPEPEPVATDPPRIVCVGRLVPQKGFDRAIDAFASLAARHPQARLIVAGDGPERAALERRAHLAAVGDRVEFLGMVDRAEVGRVLAGASVVLMTSHYDGLPLVALEAAWRARPVVAVRAPGLARAIVDGETGLVVHPDASALATALDRVLTTPGLARRLGAAARTRARHEYSIETCADRYESLYRRLARGDVATAQ